MKKQSASSSGSFKLRVLVVTVLCSLGLFLALVGFGAMEISALAFGSTDINLITGPETSPRVTQSTSATWGHGNTIVVAYEDSSGNTLSPNSVCGVSTSTDGGATFTRLPYKFNATGTCSGQPAVFYSVRAGKWFASFIAGRCGGIGIGWWTSTDGITWTEGGCAFSGTGADFPSIWVDNNPASPFYGNQYAAFNDFNIGGVPRVARSTDNGATWSVPVNVAAIFRRAIKITGSPGADGAVYLQTMDEGGGGLNGPRQNFIYRSTDSGATWSSPLGQGASFLGPGRSVSGYFPGIYSTPVAGYWSDMGWGEPAVGPGGVVHYVYAARSATDPGNIFYVRSTDTGFTWSAPLKLNTDATSRAQWGPSLSANAQGRVFVTWYDERNTTTDALQRFGRASLNNGASWGTDTAQSDVIFPKPLQPDPNFSATRVGVYNRTAFSNDGIGAIAYHAWTDGRVSINGSPQQNVFFDKIFLPAAFGSDALRSDFNRDGFSDYLLFHPSTGKTAVWYLQGNLFSSSVFGKALPAGWSVVGSADLNQNGAPDYLLFHASTRRTAIWFLDDATLVSASFGPTLPVGWKLIAATDLNGDGKPDYVLFNPTTRRSAAWFLNGAVRIGTAFGPTLPAGWSLIDALDFNTDGKADYLLFDATTRRSAIWYLNGTAFTGAVLGPTLPAGWTLKGAAEFNANGKPDLVLFAPSTRRTAIWYLNGATFAGAAFGPTLAPGYSLVSP